MKRLITSLLVIGLAGHLFSQVGISSTTFTPDESAMLEVVSTAKGILIPRMTQTERDAIMSPLLQAALSTMQSEINALKSQQAER